MRIRDGDLRKAWGRGVGECDAEVGKDREQGKVGMGRRKNGR